MKFRWSSVAWSVAYLLLLLSLTTPLLIITTLFMIVPAVVLFTTLNTRQFVLHVFLGVADCRLDYAIYLLIAAYFLSGSGYGALV